MQKNSPRQKSIRIRKNSSQRPLGVDLHRDSFLVCVREEGQSQLSRWSLDRVQEFAETLRPSDELAASFGLVPRVEQSNRSEPHGRIPRRGHKLARTPLVPCALIAKRYSPFRHRF